jgi:hypothetical protein
MSDQVINGIVAIAIAIIGVAVIAVLISKNADTSNVLTKGGAAFSNALCVALSPVMGGSCGGGAQFAVDSTIHF